MPSVWARREQPILAAIADLSSSRNPGLQDIQTATGLTFKDVQVAVQNLLEADYLTGIDVSNMGVGFELMEIRLLERGLRATGIWPSDPYEEFVDVVGDAIANESDPVKRTRLEGLLGSLNEVGKGVATSVITDLIKRSAGLP